MKIKNILTAIFVMVIAVIVLMLLFPQEKTGNVTNENLKVKDCGQGTIFYGEENLCWQKSAKPEPAKNWQDANDYCNNLELGKKDDWRLPKVNELKSLVITVPPEQVTIDTAFFTDTQTDYYWTATEYPKTKGTHWFVYFKTGYEGISQDFKKDYEVRCVRDDSLA
ncbi:MAG: FimH-like protein [archaeon GW2011_AR19]|nr:MAG: FimH-like protein [archaeon GW2011_AR19]